MALVPLEISGKEFRKVFRGYDPFEVAEFLEQVSHEVGALLSEKDSLVSELEAVKDNLAKYHDLEDTIKETLLLAQKTKDDLIDAAKKQSELIVEEAHRQGRKVEERYARIKAAKKQFEIEFDTLIESFRERLRESRTDEETGDGGDDAD